MRLPAIIFLIILPVLIFAQEKSKKVLAGVITDQNGSELQDVHVVSVKKGYGTTTNAKGYFRLEVEAPDTIRFVYVGMKDKLFPVDPESDQVQIMNVLLEPSSVVLKEVKVSPFLSRENLRYEGVPMDAAESTRRDLREKALHTDKTRFSTFGFNFAPAIISLFSSTQNKIPNENDPERKIQIRDMRLKLAMKGDSLFSKGIPMDSLKHPSRDVFNDDE